MVADVDDIPIDPDLPAQGQGRLAIASVALGGALGAPARYEVTRFVGQGANAFPWATFCINVSGSFVLGVLLVLLIERYPSATHVRAFVTTGFLGAFTTYSTFAVEADLLVRGGRAGLAFAYAFTSLAAGIGAAWLGISLGRPLGRR